MKKYLFSLLILISGCITDRSTIKSSEHINEFPDIISWANDPPFYEESGKWWMQEAKKRFNSPIIFICHGTTVEYSDNKFNYKTWYLVPNHSTRTPIPTQTVATTLANMYPERDIVMVVCNKEGNCLKTKRIWYLPKGLVLAQPKIADLTYNLRKHILEDGTIESGDIWDFVSYDEREDFTPTSQPSN
jgi:hypothetical protein